MRSLQNYIISTNNRYNNKVDVGDKELILNTEITERDYMFVNRIATVISTPLELKTPIKKGDDIIVHHNVFRRWFDIRGAEKNSTSFLSEDTYFVTEDQVFAYKRDEEWKGLPDFCFVKPVENKDEWGLKDDANLAGELIYTNDYLSSIGVSTGDVVGFKPNSEYEFNIEGQKLYRILSNHITINYGSKRENSSSS
tara:strand:- start:568 stop:1155 length:588 start_codon:yes stop_codon:yes gene_type:complete